MNVINMPTGELIPYENNTKIHPPEQVEHIANSIKRFGWQQPIVIDKNKVVIIGHGRLLAAKQMGLQEVPVVYADDLSEEDAQALRLADNKLNESPWDFTKLEEELAQLAIDGIDMSQFGFEDDIELPASENEHVGSLAEKYLVPPFSVIYCNKPDWLARKRRWVDFGIRSELGRGGDLLTIQGAIQRQTSYLIGGGQSGAKPSRTTPD